MFCACVQPIPQCESQDNKAVTSVYTEFSEKLFDTIVNEFIKRDKFLNNRTAQLMLRDKLKFYASLSATCWYLILILKTCLYDS